MDGGPDANVLEIPGFPVPGALAVNEYSAAQKKAKQNKKGGGFQAMGLSHPVALGINKRGYKIPTPIQRKTIPLILEGRDVVAMAKTGSGKTACFLIPMFERLKQRDPTKGARALIFSPTRELAIQTFKFIRELGKFLDLKVILVLGGDSMDSQFSAIHTCPDVIVGTPGRFLHLCVEMDLKLSSVEYVVFDEADRLFEMGFGEQLNETLSRLPEARQTVMFSATLPKLLVDFAKAGLSDPVLIRLDVESKIPEGLVLKFLHCRPDERYTTLVVLLKYIIPKDSQTVVFAGTQHHVELISSLLTSSGISNTSIYSSLDPSARKINTAKFVHKKVSVLIVTDIAARGIDIPSLDFVINVHFPGKPKLFIHRVGRCARAGRRGTAYTICSTEDEAHLLDLHLFLNRPFNISDNNSIGVIPQDILEEEHHTILEMLKSHHIAGTYRTSENAYKKYLSSRPAASVESNKKVKNIKFFALKSLEEFVGLSIEIEDDSLEKIKRKESERKEDLQQLDEQKHNILMQMRNYRPSGTIFELNPHKKSFSLEVMKQKRAAHSVLIDKYRINHKDTEVEEQHGKKSEKNEETKDTDEQDIKKVFGNIVGFTKPKNSEVQPESKSRKKTGAKKDLENYIPYQSADKHTEEGFAINNFDRQAQNAEFSIVDKAQTVKYSQGMKKWDRVKKKMVSVQDPRIGKIRTESGLWIPATYKTGRYKDWKEKTKIEEQVWREEEGNEAPLSHEQRYPVSRHARHNAKVEAKKRMGVDSELRNPEQIVKKRLRVEFAKKRELDNRIKKLQNKKKHAQKMRRKKPNK